VETMIQYFFIGFFSFEAADWKLHKFDFRGTGAYQGGLLSWRPFERDRKCLGLLILLQANGSKDKSIPFSYYLRCRILDTYLGSRNKPPFEPRFADLLHGRKCPQ
jgi:hypothetical protein